MSQRNAKEFVNIFALILSIIGGLIAIFLIPYAEFKAYLISNSNWAFPIILLFAILFLGWFGFCLSKINLRRGGSKNGPDRFIDILDREREANTIWIVTSIINYDIHNSKYIEVIRENLRKRKSYRYIVPGNDNVYRNILNYKKLYNLTEHEIHNMFLIVDDSDLSQFFRTITIYDPHERNTEAYFYGYTTDSGNNDYMMLDRNKTIQYVKRFKDVWHKNKEVNP